MTVGTHDVHRVAGHELPLHPGHTRRQQRRVLLLQGVQGSGIDVEGAPHLGGVGLNFDYGSQRNLVRGNVFHDISSHGIQIGNLDRTMPLVTDNVIDNNYVHDVGVEYPGAYGLWNANTQGTTVSHNVQTTMIPAGGAAILEFRAEVPGDFHFVDHAIFRAEKGALGTIHVSGDRELAIFNGNDGPMAH